MIGVRERVTGGVRALRQAGPRGQEAILIMLRLIRTTIIGGIIFLVPIAIFVAVIGKGLEINFPVAGEQSDRWEESGYWLTPVMVALLLPFFRRGWMAQTASRA